MLGLGLGRNKRYGSGTPFKINHSFNFGGVNQIFTIPNADLTGYISGINKDFTLNVMFKKDVSGEYSLFSSYAGGSQRINFRINGTNKLEMFLRDSGGNKAAVTTNSTANETWYFVSFVHDGNTPANSKIYVNGTDWALATNTLTNEINATFVDYAIGMRQSNFYFNGLINQVGLIDRVATLEEHQEMYKGGKPLSPVKVYGSNSVWDFNPDNSGDTAQFSVVDSVNSITATSVNMIDADKTTTTPY